MTLFAITDKNAEQAKYLQLVDAVKNAIRSGQLVAGDPLPSVKSIAEDRHLNRHTVMKSFAELVAQGWIEATQRIGYKVVANLPIEQAYLASSNPPAIQPIEHRFVRTGSQLAAVQATEFAYNFSGGLADLARFPYAEFKRCMSAALLRPNLSQMSYGQTAGTDELIGQVKTYLRRSRGICNREIVITNGSQEALFIVAQLLLQKGDKVAVETLGYPPAMAAFSRAGAELLGIKQDDQGMCADDLAKQINTGNVRLIYLTPLHQYPTTVTLPISRRIAIYQLAAKHQIPIVEDDYDHEFHYRCQPLAPMAADDPAQLIIYLSTFSKIMFPGARVGVMALSHAMAKAAIQYRLLISHKSNVLMQAALANWMASGGFERHLRRTTRLNMQRRDHAVNVLNQHACFTFNVPDGGMALWVKINTNTHLISAKAITEACQTLGVYIQPEQDFQFDGKAPKDQHIRLGFAGMNEAQFTQGIGLLVRSIRDFNVG